VFLIVFFFFFFFFFFFGGGVFGCLFFFFGGVFFGRGVNLLSSSPPLFSASGKPSTMKIGGLSYETAASLLLLQIRQLFCSVESSLCLRARNSFPELLFPSLKQGAVIKVSSLPLDVRAL